MTSTETRMNLYTENQISNALHIHAGHWVGARQTHKRAFLKKGYSRLLATRARARKTQPPRNPPPPLDCDLLVCLLEAQLATHRLANAPMRRALPRPWAGMS